MLSLNSNFVFRNIYDVKLLVPKKRNDISNDVIYLNDTAAMIIEACCKWKNSQEDDMTQMANALANQFMGEDKETIAKDIREYIEGLISTKLLVKT